MTYKAAAEAESFCKCALRSSHHADRDIFGKWETCSDCERPIEGTYQVSGEDNKLFG